MSGIEILASQAVIAVVTTLLTVWLALRRFYSEKWWERKLAAYVSVIEALTRMQDYLEREYRSYMQGFEISKELESQMAAEARIGRGEVARAAAAGAFLISSEASECLNKCMQELNQSSDVNDFFESVDIELAAVRPCLIALTSIAKRDLGVK